MKAVVYAKYGSPDVLELKEVAKPTPKSNEILIKVHAATVTAGDVNARGFTFVPPGFGPIPRLIFGLTKPKRTILGFEVAGEVESLGKEVKAFKQGNQVFGSTGMNLGAYAEYVCLPENCTLDIKPSNMTYEEAASIPFGGETALSFLRDMANVKPGQKVLINGASGGVGVYAVQIAKYYGADVTGVCSTANLELVRSLGADRVIDYTKQDFRKNGETYDVIMDTVCGENSFSRCKNSLKPNGLYLAVAGSVREMLQAALPFMTGGRKVITGPAADRKEDLVFLKELIEAGKLNAVIDRRYPLEQTAEAHRYVDTGRKRGSVVITVCK